MGRKKKSVVTNGGQTELVDEVDGVKSKENKCCHIKKAISPTCVEKKIQSIKRGELHCSLCLKNTPDAPTSEGVWVCLKCGYLFCKPHCDSHFEVPRSDLHVLFYCNQDCKIWCYKCRQEVKLSDRGGLKSVAASIDKRMEREAAAVAVSPTVTEAPASPLITALPNLSNGAEGPAPPLLAGPPTLSGPIPLLQPSVHELPHRRRPLPSTPTAVKGLTNLGNTCFFNSVLQCLARTPGLVNSLHQLDKEEQHISLTLSDGHKLEGKLERSSDSLGACLSETLEALCSPGGGTYTPSKLLSLLRKKCPQFEGYEQHDAHELLRHLLDNVRLTDHKRYRSVVLKEMGLSWKFSRTDISDEVHAKLKALDHEVTEKVTLVPDDVFKGQLVSTLECQDCHHISSRVESFMDLSLPVVAESETMLMKRKLSSSPELVDEKAGQVSKHQLKKEKKMAISLRRRQRKGQQGGGNSAPERALSPSSTNATNSSDRGESDADVEDNEEVEKRHESGYSSEKGPSENGESEEVRGACGEDSARTSPTTDGALCEGYPLVGEWCGGNAGWTGEGEWQGSCRQGVRMSSALLPGTGGVSSDPCDARLWLASDRGSPLPVLVPDPADTLASWQSDLPRGGQPPVSCPSLPLGSIIEEDHSPTTDLRPPQTQECTLNKLSIVHKLADNILSRVSLFQKEDQGARSCQEEATSQGCEPSPHPLQVCEGEQLVPEVSGGSFQCSRTGDVAHSRAKVGENYSVSTLEDSAARPSSPSSSEAVPLSPDTTEALPVSPSNIEALSLSTVHHEGQPLSPLPKGDDVSSTSPHSPQIQPLLTFFSSSLKITDEENKQGTEEKGHEAEANTSVLLSAVDTFQHSKDYGEEGRGGVSAAVSYFLDYTVPHDKYTEEEKEEKVQETPEKKEVIALGYYEDAGSSSGEGTSTRKEAREQGDKDPEPYQELITEFSVSRRKERPQQEAHHDSSDYCIHSCLNQFISVELLSDSNKVGCSACTTRASKGKKDGKTVYTIATKQFLIKEAPAVLILHLKRFQLQMYSFRKLGKHVSFPLVLDLSPFCVNELADEGDLLYCLYGVVEHSGTLNGGHYVAYVKVDCNGGGEEGDGSSYCWFHISDSHVYKVTEQRVLTTQAYLLFYKRLPPTQHLTP